MCLQNHFFLLVLTILIISSSFSPPFCLSSYPFPEHDHILTNITNSSTNNNFHEDQDHKQGSCLNNQLANYERADILDDHVKHLKRGRGHYQSTVLPSRALAPTFSPPRPRVISVEDYTGSSSPQNRDDTEAFKKAWKEACSSTLGVFLVPNNKKYRVGPINFSGPCRSHFTIKILGSIEASDNMTDYKDRQHWLVFENIRNFQVQGGGTIDGKGKIWWQNSCKINKTRPCEHAPTAVTFLGCKNFRVDGLRIRNAQQMQLSFQRCSRVRASNLVVKAPGNSPNTDGIHVTQTRNIVITKSVIRTGDDCISIVSGSKNVEAIDIKCGPGHGISIGSLGKGGSKAHVSTVLVNRVTFSGTSNGVRIKTWQGGRGYAKNIVFENITMRNVSNPIIIDQHYCDQKTPCQEMKSAVQVKNVVYKNIKGTSASQVAIKLDCSKRHGCGGIVLDNVNLVREGGGGGGGGGGGSHKQVVADCQNVKVYNRGKVSPKCFQNFPVDDPLLS